MKMESFLFTSIMKCGVCVCVCCDAHFVDKHTPPLSYAPLPNKDVTSILVCSLKHIILRKWK